MLDDLIEIFRSLAKSLDVLYVIKGDKPAGRIIASEGDLDSYKRFFKKHDIHYSLSDYKLRKETDENKYSNKGVALPRDSEEKGELFIYFSKDKALAEKAKHAEKDSDHKELGRMLGYPECCTDFFNKEFPKQSRYKNDYVLASLRESKGFIFPFQNNISIRHLDLSLLSHFPCNLNCPKSKEMAGKNFELLEKDSPDLARISEGMLKGAVVFTSNRGIFLLRDIKMEKDKLYYDKIMASMKNEIYDELKMSKAIEIIDKNTIMIRDKKIEDIGMMVFI